MLKPISPVVDFPKLEGEILKKWQKEDILKKYLQKNNKSIKKFSFLDGPITANNPMGVHHAWGRTYKDFWQRFFNMRNYKQRFQNGFDEQGLWVEVEVEKELGLRNKKDIENLIPGDKFKSLEKFINLCKKRVKKFSTVQTEQSKRLGYFMDWEHSYHTSSAENNYAIWNFLSVVNKKGWLYKGHDTVPWCPRCGTAISQHEILTEEYKEINHTSIYFRLPIVGRKNEYLLVWTTTPWTIPGNIALAINPEFEYVKADFEGDKYYLAKSRLGVLSNIVASEKADPKEMLKFTYIAPFDELPRVKKTLGDYVHKVVDAKEIVTGEEGTGILHVAPGQGEEDFKLGKELNLPVIELIDEEANYIDGLGEFSGKNAKKHPELIIDFLTNKNKGEFFLKTENVKHRYPTCWRCKTELVWRIVDEWYIAMDITDESGKTYREQMVEVAKTIEWLPEWGLDRELDWLKNMHSWLISKKRYWGLALPIWECKKCKNFEVIGSFVELKDKAVEGWDKFEGNSPHRPWIDQIKIKCSSCKEICDRIPDVGNPWLDAGIVPFSTMPEDWFPADFITESFPGQFKNWFYSLIAMSTALKNEKPVKTILGFGSVRDEKGEEMHKTKGNAVNFDEAAEKIGVDVMRWLYLRTNPEHNVNFGYRVTDEIRRFFHLRLWNVYSFFIMYAVVDNWKHSKSEFKPNQVLDKWILSRLNGSIKNITQAIEKYDACDACGLAEIFVINDLSNWYVRRIRDRVGPNALNGKDKDDAYQTLWFVLTQYSKIIAPFMPFIADEVYTNLTNDQSVHLVDWPTFDEKQINNDLEKEMEEARKIAEAAHSFRKQEGIKVRIPIKSASYSGTKLSEDVTDVLKAEINVQNLKFDQTKKDGLFFADSSLDNQDTEAGEAREIIRQIQAERKSINAQIDQYVKVTLLSWPRKYEELIKKQALIKTLEKGEFSVEKNV